MQVSIERVSPADTAKAMRKALKDAFPGVKFSVRLSRGSATYVNWTDGPTRQQVGEVVAFFTSEDFDGMTDSRNYLGPQILVGSDGTITERRYQSGLVICSRDWSDEISSALIAIESNCIDGITRQPISEREAHDAAWREFSRRDLS